VSTLSVGNLQGLPTNSNVITIPAGHVLYAPGMIAQVKYVRTDARNTYASSTSGNGTTVTDLNISITPKFANSLLIMQWMVNGEFHHDNVFLIHKDGALITTTGYEGYNNVAGNNRWSGVAPPAYDTDSNSTSNNTFIQYAILAGGTASATYAPAVRASQGTAYTFHLNRTQGSTGTDSYEVSISTGMIMEVMQ
jgi:hypothetical protein